MAFSLKWAVIWAAGVAVTCTGKRGFVAWLWLCVVFGLPFAVWLWSPNDPGRCVAALLLFLVASYILFKRHYLLKHTIAGLLKDRQT